MRPIFLDSRTSIHLAGRPIPGAEDRQRRIAGFDQAVFSRSRILCIGAGGLIGNIAPALARKGIGGLAVYDHDSVEVSNLNRQRFYPEDVGSNKAVALIQNLQRECIVATDLKGYGVRFEEAVVAGLDLSCDLAICGVDNNPARVAASRYFRQRGAPIIFAAVSEDGDHGFVFVQGVEGPCLGCLLPDIADDNQYPCPGTPAIADILQAVGSMAIYAADTVLMTRRRNWNYRSIRLGDATFDGASWLSARDGCQLLGLEHSPSHDR